MSGRPRVRHLLKGLGPGGAERLVVAQTRAGGGYEHDVVHLLPGKDHLVPLLTETGVRVTCLDTDRLGRPGWVRRLRRLLIDDPTEILHIHSPAVAAVARLVVRTLPLRARPAVVTTEHNRWPRHHRLTRLANRATIRLDDAVLAVSDDVRATVRGRRRDDVRTIVHGIDLDAVRSSADRSGVRAELGASDDDVVVVCVANLRPEKALDQLVTAARIALEQAPALRYVLVGQGPLADDLDGWIASAGVGERFTALGYRADATRVVSGGDVFTLSSRHEGLPVAVMEALALGVPVAATAAGGLPDAVGDAGLISPVDDPAALAANHVRLAGDPAARARLSAAAVVEAERFSVERAVAEIGEIYATVTAGTARSARSRS